MAIFLENYLIIAAILIASKVRAQKAWYEFFPRRRGVAALYPGLIAHLVIFAIASVHWSPMVITILLPIQPYSVGVTVYILAH